ncbi:hypothetical protein PIIN_08074 [Serendipita indica DSM 11827]|uniref:Uncharacterized protein n=1 Tax=Serendipita indica (strain DSM 11827) TaxID=1109443 RepID=G4TS27_SERID|nr:hypothetical protein PIIN_08074 [Serendipita indica DSM 11827]
MMRSVIIRRTLNATTATRTAPMAKRTMYSSPVSHKTATEKVKEVADNVNRKVGQGLASAIETGEHAAESVKNATGMSSGEAKRAVNEKATEAKQTVNQKTAEAKDTLNEKSQQAKEIWNEKSADAKQKASETAEEAKQKANLTAAGARQAKEDFTKEVRK